MKKRKKGTVFEGIMTGAREAVAYSRGEANKSQYQVHIAEDIGAEPSATIDGPREY